MGLGFSEARARELGPYERHVYCRLADALERRRVLDLVEAFRIANADKEPYRKNLARIENEIRDAENSFPTREDGFALNRRLHEEISKSPLAGGGGNTLASYAINASELNKRHA